MSGPLLKPLWEVSMMPRLFAALAAVTLTATSLGAQQDTALTDDELLALYEGLRVADVSDGMDMVGLRDVGLVDPRIQALWKDIDELDHQFRGIAVTVRYVPHNRIVRNPMSEEEFAAWEGEWYNEVSSEPFVEHLKPGSVVVIDASGDGDTGSIGSANSLGWVERGAVGIVTTGSVRDTDEIAKQEIPLYVDPLHRGRGIRPGRNMVESVNQPVEIGGALVRPGDVVVADGDGVIVVPREHAPAVARAARRILDSDMATRRELYERLGRPLDQTVLPDTSGTGGQ
jgi:4-hydroxy-4-methyl-2-oxoglutarate aldolase